MAVKCHPIPPKIPALRALASPRRLPTLRRHALFCVLPPSLHPHAVLARQAAPAPVKVAVLPLVKKDGLPEKARAIIDTLKLEHKCQYDEKDSIGKRYRRQDAIGTPLCITVDHQSAEDGTVTVRDRDTMRQERVHIEAIPALVESKAGMRALLDKLA